MLRMLLVAARAHADMFAARAGRPLGAAGWQIVAEADPVTLLVHGMHPVQLLREATIRGVAAPATLAAFACRSRTQLQAASRLQC